MTEIEKAFWAEKMTEMMQPFIKQHEAFHAQLERLTAEHGQFLSELRGTPDLVMDENRENVFPVSPKAITTDDVHSNDEIDEVAFATWTDFTKGTALKHRDVLEYMTTKIPEADGKMASFALRRLVVDGRLSEIGTGKGKSYQVASPQNGIDVDGIAVTVSPERAGWDDGWEAPNAGSDNGESVTADEPETSEKPDSEDMSF